MSYVAAVAPCNMTEAAKTVKQFYPEIT